MLNPLKTSILCISLLTATTAVSLATGAIIAKRQDMAEALNNGAGYYSTTTGQFKFAVAPVLLDEPKLEELPMPKHKPKR